MESDDKSSIPSRQLTEDLFSSTAVLALGASYVSPVRLVAGFSAVNLLAFSNFTFRVRVEEAVAPGGPWQETQRWNSALDGAGVRQFVAQRFVPMGSYLRVSVDNTGAGAQTLFGVAALGIPIGDTPNVNLPVLGSVAINDCGTGTTELSVKPDGTDVGPCGSALVGARNPSDDQVDLRVDANGRLLVTPADEAPGTDIQSPALTNVPAASVVALPAIPANVRRMRVQNRTQNTVVLVREVLGAPGIGRGVALAYLGSTSYGSAAGAIEPLEAENLSATTAADVAVQFEVD